MSLANKGFSEVIRDGFRLFVRNYRTLIIPLAIFQIILLILNTFLLTDLNLHVNSIEINILDLMEQAVITESDLNAITRFLVLSIGLIFFQNLIGALVITIAMCSVSNYVYNRYIQTETSFSTSFKSAFNTKIFLVILIVGICLPFSSILLIPSIFIFAFFIFLVFTYNIKGIKKPAHEARRVAKGAFWKIIGIFLINVMIISSIRMLYTSFINLFFSPNPEWFNPATRNYGMIILYDILLNLVDILLAPLFICLLTALFAAQKARKDIGSSYQHRAYYVREEEYDPSSSQFGQKMGTSEKDHLQDIRIEGQFYCPYCGALVDRPKKFCPRCGENLSFIDN
ncbi:MAG: hypothetical protein ACW990_12050 [Promethearchaeota archaeon]